MALPCYEPKKRFALAEEPDFPDEKTAKEFEQFQGQLDLQEWRTYYLKWFGDEPDFVGLMDKSQLTQGQGWSGQVREINFKNYVGLARLGPMQVRVENRKIGDDRFHALLDNVADHYADLIFGFTKDPVGHGFRRHGPVGRNLLYVEYLFLRRYLLTEDIEGIVAAILRNPHDKMRRETHSVPLPMARATDPIALLYSLCRGDHLALLEPSHHLCDTPIGQAILRRSGKALFPSEVPEERRYHTYDTHENRFAKHVLENIERRLEEVSEVVKRHTGGLINPEIGSDLEGLQRKVSGCLDDPFWREVGPLHFVPESSQVLQRREGYRQLFQLHALLQLLTRYDYSLFDFENLLETKDTATLYEYWCFFQVKEILDTRFARIGTELLVRTEDVRQEKQKMEPGVSISYKGGLKLCFNWTFGGSLGFGDVKTFSLRYTPGKSYSAQFRPDIVISHYDRYLVLDAKNKGEFYGTFEEGRITRHKPEDLVKMHAYRDAIDGARGAFALFPGTETQLYPAHDASQPWDGIGALALRPDSGGKPEPNQVRNLEALILGFIEVASV